eukprot:COSAG05_NODE_1206_length_5525_cov_6.815149_4_plen_106_part_00
MSTLDNHSSRSNTSSWMTQMEHISAGYTRRTKGGWAGAVVRRERSGGHDAVRCHRGFEVGMREVRLEEDKVGVRARPAQAQLVQQATCVNGDAQLSARLRCVLRG